MVSNREEPLLISLKKDTEAMNGVLPFVMARSKTVEFEFDMFTMRIQFGILLRTPNMAVKHVQFSFGTLISYNSSEVSNRESYLESLKSKEVCFRDLGSVFASISKDLFSVENLIFVECRLLGSDDKIGNWIDLPMQNTRVKDLTLSTYNTQEKDAYISLYIPKDWMKRYYKSNDILIIDFIYKLHNGNFKAQR